MSIADAAPAGEHIRAICRDIYRPAFQIDARCVSSLQFGGSEGLSIFNEHGAGSHQAFARFRQAGSQVARRFFAPRGAADGGVSPASTRGRTETSSEKTLSVMDLFTPERPEWSVEAACAALGLSESTVYRYFRSLAAAGLIFSIRPGRYLLGPGIVHYDRQLRTSDPLLRAAEPSILQLTEIYRGPGTIFISRIYRDHIMSMHEYRLGGRFVEATYRRGLLAPMFGGAPGIAILAFLEVRTVRSLFQNRAPGDEDEWLQIKRRMRAARASGYAAGVDEPDPGITYVSVPVLQAQGGVAGSLSLALPSEGVDVALAGERLIRAASEIAQQAASRASYDPVVSNH